MDTGDVAVNVGAGGRRTYSWDVAIASARQRRVSMDSQLPASEMGHVGYVCIVRN